MLSSQKTKLKYSLSDILSSVSSGHSWVLYRMPDKKDTHFVAGTLRRSTFSSAAENGFYISPFSTDETIWYIRPEKRHIFRDRLQDEVLGRHMNARQPELTEMTKSYYINMVADAVKNIKEGQFDKVVLSRNRIIRLPDTFNGSAYFNKLCARYPTAFVYMLCSPELGTWIGATPELLLKSRNKTISTIALAGTKKIFGETDVLSLFSRKEIEEQAWVTHYIHDILNTYSSKVTVKGPGSRQAGNMAHLVTEFTAAVENNNLHLVLLLLDQLHPTPAVCGTPKRKAREYIINTEAYPRELYSGFMGWIEDEQADVYVNLRCMQLFSEFATLYAGAGIVEGSVPEDEWQETETKLQTLLSVL